MKIRDNSSGGEMIFRKTGVRLPTAIVFAGCCGLRALEIFAAGRASIQVLILRLAGADDFTRSETGLAPADGFLLAKTISAAMGATNASSFCPGSAKY